MNRTKSQRIPALLLSLLLAVAMAGCQGGTDGTLDPNDPALQGMTGLESGEYAIFDFEDAMDAVQDASLEEPMAMDPELCSGRVFQPGHRFGPHGPNGPGGPRQARVGSHLHAILHAMRLTVEQREQVRDLMAAHRECVREPSIAVCENSQDIIEDANEQRRAIIEAEQNGEITREEAHEQIRALNRATQEAIREDPDNQEAFAELCECKLVLFDGIRSILDEEQQAVWDAWVAMIDDPCLAGE